MAGSAAPLPPTPPAVSEVADITAMFLAHPHGYTKLIKILESAALEHKRQYDAAAQAVVLGGNHAGMAARALGAQQSMQTLIDTLQKIQTGQMK